MPVVLFVVVTKGDPETFLGGGTWQSLAVAGVEGVVLVSLSLWLLDVFRRRYNHQQRGRPPHDLRPAGVSLTSST